MKVLILSCNTGEGHNSAARALSGHLISEGFECTVTDTLSLVGKNISQMVSDLYLYSTRTSLFKYVYKIGMSISISLEKFKSPVYHWNSFYASRLQQYIEEGRFDAVVCTHLFPAEAMTAIRKKGGLKSIPCIFIMTDYTCIPFLDETELDAYVIPHEHLTEEFAERGIDRRKLYPFGIPVSAEFHSKSPKKEARQAVIKDLGLALEPESSWLLIMTGSMGFGNTQKIVDEIQRQRKGPVDIIVICGKNAEMLKSLKEKNTENVHPVGYTDRIPLLMDACDVLFTKPGGISSTEAMSKHIPLIHTEPIPGCETRNAEFFHYHGMSFSSRNIRRQVNTALRLCHDRRYRKKMTDAQRLNARPDTCQNISDLIRDLIS